MGARLFRRKENTRSGEELQDSAWRRWLKRGALRSRRRITFRSRFLSTSSFMKTRFIACCSPVILGFLALASACSEKARSDASTTAKDIYADTKDAVTNAWDKVKSYSFDKRGDFTTKAKALSAKMEADASALRANYSDAKASASRRAAMAELKDSEKDYKEKVAALGNATADTWESAKQNAIASWDRLQAAYYKARTE